jgi:Flp pilus assembly pilin Flp
MKNLFARFVREEAGQDLIEYALIATFVSIAAAAGAKTLASGLSTWYTNMGNGVANMDVTP